MPSTSRKANAIVSALLDWYKKNARDLPWRRTSDPYAIWVSEIMLQQTQVKTVLPYWQRWMTALPTIADLAAAKPERIHKLWEGLGYYTRVRNLQKAAREIVSKHNGQFPRDYNAILDLPGIGRYTAGAISSIAFNEPQPILDGNVIRVLTRLFGVPGNVRDKQVNAELWDLALVLVRRAAALPDAATLRTCSHLNQSLMELGALICMPRQPACQSCPVSRLCTARRTGQVDTIPNLGTRVLSTPRRFAAFVIERRSRFLVRQRPAGVVNAYLWEFPNVEVNGEKLDPRKLAGTELGFTPAKLEKLIQIKHTITRYRITLEAFRGVATGAATPARPGWRWLPRQSLLKLPFTAAHRRILLTLENLAPV